jgi:predicted ATP-grasp superfamily ATP-dependent carboligase
MTPLRDPENVAIASLVRIINDPAAARAVIEEYALARAGIIVRTGDLEARVAEADLRERQLAERERQVTAREANVRRRERALHSGSK